MWSSNAAVINNNKKDDSTNINCNEKKITNSLKTLDVSVFFTN